MKETYTEADVITLACSDGALRAMRAMLRHNFGTIADYLSFNRESKTIDLSNLASSGVRNLLYLLDTGYEDFTKEEYLEIAIVADFLNIKGRGGDVLTETIQECLFHPVYLDKASKEDLGILGKIAELTPHIYSDFMENFHKRLRENFGSK